jgi:hypothetical protein
VKGWSLFVVLAGCAGGAASGRSLDAGDPSDADATVPDGASAEGGACPVAAPLDGIGCDVPGLWCEYGGVAHGRCATRAVCAKRGGGGTGGVVVWTVFGPDVPCTNIGACPVAFAASDAGCPVLYGVCDYDAGRCACAECAADAGSGDPYIWQCRGWDDVKPFLADAAPANAPGACPPDRPRLGTECVDEGIVCGYDACYGVSLGPYLACADGRWAVGPQTDLCNPPTCH